MYMAFVCKNMHNDILRIQQVLRKPSSSECDVNHDTSLHMCWPSVQAPHRVELGPWQECALMPATVRVCHVQ